MSYKIGNGYIGSDSIQTSVANQEIIPASPLGWTHGYSLYKFSFINDQDCTIKINNGNPIFLRMNQGFNTEKEDAPITSFKIVEGQKTFSWIGAY